MLLPVKVAAAIREGTASLAFRRWTKPEVKVGSTFLTSAGLMRVEEVTEVDSARDQRRRCRARRLEVGRRTAEEVPRRWQPRLTYRVRLSWAGEDPRHELRERELTDEDVAMLDTKLDRLDRASSHGPWTIATLHLIGRNPRVRAPDLAAEQGRERDPFKIDVRKLKNLGLTISHEVGYELSPRGIAFLARSPYAQAHGERAQRPGDND